MVGTARPPFLGETRRREGRVRPGKRKSQGRGEYRGYEQKQSFTLLGKGSWRGDMGSTKGRPGQEEGKGAAPGGEACGSVDSATSTGSEERKE